VLLLYRARFGYFRVRRWLDELTAERVSWFGSGLLVAGSGFVAYLLVVAPLLAAHAEPPPPRPLPPPVRVQVVGEVAQPGTYDLPHTARVEDVLRMAGGLTEHADVAYLNVAARLMDGQRIVVNRIRPAEGASARASPTRGPPQQRTSFAQARGAAATTPAADAPTGAKQPNAAIDADESDAAGQTDASDLLDGADRAETAGPSDAADAASLPSPEVPATPPTSRATELPTRTPSARATQRPATRTPSARATPRSATRPPWPSASDAPRPTRTPTPRAPEAARPTRTPQPAAAPDPTRTRTPPPNVSSGD
jgi:DNA uptake protein ComE-like DNA-binding protein